MEKFDDGLVAFSRGLATDQKQSALLDALVETMAKSPYRGKHCTNTLVIFSKVFHIKIHWYVCTYVHMQ